MLATALAADPTVRVVVGATTEDRGAVEVVARVETVVDGRAVVVVGSVSTTASVVGVGSSSTISTVVVVAGGAVVVGGRVVVVAGRVVVVGGTVSGIVLDGAAVDGVVSVTVLVVTSSGWAGATCSAVSCAAAISPAPLSNTTRRVMDALRRQRE